MSSATLWALQKAITEHFAEGQEPGESKVVINWVVGVTESYVDTGDEVQYDNNWAAAEGDPNATAGLAGWLGENCAGNLHIPSDADVE